jgi:hypothetical protein
MLALEIENEKNNALKTKGYRFEHTTATARGNCRPCWPASSSKPSCRYRDEMHGRQIPAFRQEAALAKTPVQRHPHTDRPPEFQQPPSKPKTKVRQQNENCCREDGGHFGNPTFLGYSCCSKAATQPPPLF